MLTEAVFGWADGRRALLLISCLHFLICFAMSMHVLHLYQEKNHFWFLENPPVAMSRKLSLRGSAEF